MFKMKINGKELLKTDKNREKITNWVRKTLMRKYRKALICK
jgi:hypothetical protein